MSESSKAITEPIPIVQSNDDTEQEPQRWRRMWRVAAGIAAGAVVFAGGARVYEEVEKYWESRQLADVTGIVEGITGKQSNR